MSSEAPLLEAVGIGKSFFQGRNTLEILKDLNLTVQEREAICILGGSGAGKSTLLHILGTLDRPTLGRVFFSGEDLFKKSDDELARFRNQTMGFVFQFHHLLPEFSALENVMMPCRIAGESGRQASQKALRLLRLLGLEQRQKHYPTELSGGERQRVAIARALVREPKILFADEPTGNLDSTNGRRIQDLFFDLQKELGLTLIVVTHDREFAERFPRQLEMADGQWVKSAEDGSVLTTR